MAGQGVLVAGGTGALGTAVLRELLDAGFDVTATWLVAAERERVEQELGDKELPAFVEADLMEQDVWRLAACAGRIIELHGAAPLSGCCRGR